MRENTGQENSEYRQFLRSNTHPDFETEHLENVQNPDIYIYITSSYLRCLTGFRHNNKIKLTKNSSTGRITLTCSFAPWKNPSEINTLQNSDIDFVKT